MLVWHGVSQQLCSHSPLLVLEALVGFLIWLAWVQLWPCFLPALGQPTPGRGCVNMFCMCFRVLLKSDAKV